MTLPTAMGLFQKGSLDDAAKICMKILQNHADHPDTCHLLGMIARAQHDQPAAQAWMTKAASAAPLRADILNDFGLVLMDRKAFLQALEQFELAIVQDARMAQSHFNKGLALKALGRRDAAAASFQKALACDPGFSRAHFCLGDMLLDQGDPVGAEGYFSTALRIAPDYIAAYNHLAICLEQQYRADEAIHWLTRAHNIDPQCADTLCNLGNLMRKKGRYAEAACMYRGAIARRYNFIEAHVNLALVLLMVENFEEGWQEYEWRLKHFDATSGYPFRHGLPLWSGESLTGKAILIYDEQGFGDVFMFCRFLKPLKSMAAKVVFEVRQPLYECFKDFAWTDEIVLRKPGLAPRIPCDLCLPLMSLPLRLGLTRETMEAQEPYLSARRDKTDRWARRISGGGLKVGLAWRGSEADPTRRLDIHQLAPLSGIPGISWYGLQKESPGRDMAKEEIVPWLEPLGPHLDDFTDTAAVIANLDLVISIDTAVAHLAGAMGKPVWVLLPFTPDWRWFMNTSVSPWYPSMRLFRQSAPGDWQKSVTDVGNALQCLRQSTLNITAEAEITDVLLSEAAAYSSRGDRHNARETYRRLLAAHPDCHAAFFGLGRLYMESGDYRKAIVAFEQAAAMKFGDHLSLNNLGLCHHRSGQLDAAETAFKKAIEHCPDYITAYCNLGNIYLDRDDLDTTIHWYRRALELNPGDAQAQCEMGKLFLKNLDPANARVHFNTAVTLDPQCAEAGISLATTMLLQGDLANGWEHYRNRFKYDSFRRQAYPHHYHLPLWQGDVFPHKRLIVHAEQGYGDTIQFSRFLPDVKAKGGRVIFQVQPPLISLFENFPGIDTLEVLPQTQHETHDADLCIPLMDLPSCLNVTLDTLPAAGPYLTASPQKVDLWRSRIPAGRPNVGLVWAGNPGHSNDRNRSCPLSEMITLADLRHVQFFSLQKDLGPGDASVLATKRHIVQVGSYLNDFADTAAVIQCLDLVITVDTAIAHLAGAMGRPVWLLLPALPDWRWMLDRADSPWYPSARLFRQRRAGDWASVVDAVKQQLRKWPCPKN